jgi:HSP20 family protein
MVWQLVDHIHRRFTIPYVPSFANLQREINRMFEGARGVSREDEGDHLCDWTPSIDLVERESEYVIYVNLPGVDREDISLNVDNRGLTISGELKRTEAQEGESWYRTERPCGVFKRSFRLPETVVSDSVSAEYRNGELTITVPKAAGTKPRPIDIKSAD